MCRRSFESQDISRLAVRFRVWLICDVIYLRVPIALLKSILCCLACIVFVGFSVYLIKLGLILSKNGDIFRQIFLFITPPPPPLFFSESLFH